MPKMYAIIRIGTTPNYLESVPDKKYEHKYQAVDDAFHVFTEDVKLMFKRDITHIHVYFNNNDLIKISNTEGIEYDFGIKIVEVNPDLFVATRTEVQDGERIETVDIGFKNSLEEAEDLVWEDQRKIFGETLKTKRAGALIYAIFHEGKDYYYNIQKINLR